MARKRQTTSRVQTTNEQPVRIFESLQLLLPQMGTNDLVPVLVMTRDHESIPILEQVAGPLQVKYRYKVVPAIAATVTKAQVEIFSRQSYVRQIEFDETVHTCLDGANRWFGTAKARADFGVTGNRDGAPTYSKNDIVIAVIDTGIDGGHSDLNGGKVIGWYDWVNNKPTAYDDHGHGTHCSGIMAGTGSANPAYTGVAPGAALVGLKVLDGSGSGSLSNVAAAVDWVVQHKDDYNIRIISMSLGSSGSSDGTDTVSQAVNRAADAGIIPVIAAGNSGPAKYTIGSPGAAGRAITIASR